TTAESLTNNNEAELQKRCQERQQEIDHMQQVLETKIQLLQEEAQLARSEAERMASLAGSHSHASLISLDATMEDIPEDERAPNILFPSNKDKYRTLRKSFSVSFRILDRIELLKSIPVYHYLFLSVYSQVYRGTD
ncbi:hypothetical protein ATANTOWER_024192, partial [Ataeniobius toweri]|nr:hypothetical protein [Ataeniobius toweri]